MSILLKLILVFFYCNVSKVEALFASYVLTIVCNKKEEIGRVPKRKLICFLLMCDHQSLNKTFLTAAGF